MTEAMTTHSPAPAPTDAPISAAEFERRLIEAEAKLAIADEKLTELIKALMAEPALRIDYAKAFLVTDDAAISRE